MLKALIAQNYFSYVHQHQTLVKDSHNVFKQILNHSVL